MVKLIIFDLDGTLCDTMDDLRTAMNGMLVKLGYKTRTRSELLKFINNGAREFVRRSLPKDVQGVEFMVDSALQIYGQEYAKCYCQKTKAFEGIKAMLMELKGSGYKLAVLSNKQDEFAKNIVYSVFDKGLFDYVAGQTGLPTKPNPAGAFNIARQLGVRPNKCVIVGDSDVDVKTAINAEMQIIGVSWGYRDEEVLRSAGAINIASKPSDIIEIIEKFNS